MILEYVLLYVIGKSVIPTCTVTVQLHGRDGAGSVPIDSAFLFETSSIEF